MNGGQAGRWMLAAAAGVIFSATASAQPVAVKDAWIRAPVAGQKVAGVYMVLTSPVTSILVSIASPVAGRAELHDTTMEGGVMKMREVERIPLPGGKPVRFQPGGLHVMLIDLNQPLKPGDKVPLTLRVELPNGARSTFAAQAEVRLDAQASGHHFH